MLERLREMSKFLWHRWQGGSRLAKHCSYIEKNCSCLERLWNQKEPVVGATSQATCPVCGRHYLQQEGRWLLTEKRNFEQLLLTKA